MRERTEYGPRVTQLLVYTSVLYNESNIIQSGSDNKHISPFYHYSGSKSKSESMPIRIGQLSDHNSE